MNRRLFAILFASGIALLATAMPVGASDFPTKPLRLVVPYSTGGASDIFARVIAQKLSERLKQPVIVDNRPGAGGTIGADHVAKSAPDGYTMLFSDVGVYNVATALYPKLPYKPSDLTPVIDVASSSLLLVTASGSPLRTFQDVLSREKQQPGVLNIASGGTGTITHLMIALLNESAKTRLQHVPYKGGGAALIDVVGGQMDMMFIGAPPAMPMVAQGRLRVLAVTSPKRLANMPDVPTLAESGVSGFDATVEDAIFVAAGTPAATVALPNRELSQVIKLPDVRKRWMELGAEPGSGSTPEQLKVTLELGAIKWGKLIQEANIKLD